jgi:hypothetical protein
LKEIDKSIKHVRAAVKFIRGGSSRLVKFKKCAELAKVQSKAFLNLDMELNVPYVTCCREVRESI